MIDNGFGDKNNFVEVKNLINIAEEIPDVIHDNLCYVRSLMNRVH